MKPIEKIAVLGAGTMGGRIAAHLANAGIPTLLLDRASDGGEKNALARAGLEAARKAKPAAFFEPKLAKLITTGNFEDHLPLAAEADWIIEAVAEDLETKRALLRKVESVRRAETIVSTTTSGLEAARIASGFTPEFRRHWLATHFFNPPRYLRLVEIIPTSDTDPAVLKTITEFCDLRLGKTVVRAKDTPNFIGNRIAIDSALNIMRLMQQMEMSVEEVDALTGALLGWPKSATFRTIDMVGLDVFVQAAHNMPAEPDGSKPALPEFIQKMLERKWLGDKTGGGFYKRVAGGAPGEDLVLNWKTGKYFPLQKPGFPALDLIRQAEGAGPRLSLLLHGDRGADKATQFLWAVLSELWRYAAGQIGEISDSIVGIDRAMRFGFNWQLGPFEMWDAAGVEETVKRMQEHEGTGCRNAERLLAAGKRSWYVDTSLPVSPLEAGMILRAGNWEKSSVLPAENPGSSAPASVAQAGCVSSGRACFDLNSSSYHEVELPAGYGSVITAKRTKGVAARNAGASLVDCGDGIGCIEFHSKLNTIGPDLVQMITQALSPGGPGDNFDGFLIANDAANFSIGANLMLLLAAIQDKDWDEIGNMVRGFQRATQLIKFSPKPVLAAPFGMTLGGGCEIALHAAARQPHAELYMGLPEAGLGLIPAGGGVKEMLLRALERAEAARPGGRGESVEFAEAVKGAFETVVMPTVSTSASDARRLGFLRDGDRVTMNRERLVADAKMRVLEMVRSGYKPARPRAEIPAPGESMLATLKLGIYLMRLGGMISNHELKIATKIAQVFCGGAELMPGTLISEQYLLELEREAFLSLCGEEKTQERIQWMLKTGRVHRN